MYSLHTTVTNQVQSPLDHQTFVRPDTSPGTESQVTGMSIVLTPEEQRQFGPLFQEYDPEETQVVLGGRIRPLLERSGLPPAQLGQIWQISDAENRGFLDKTGFAKTMRIIYHVQQGQPLSARLATIPASLPAFDRQPAPEARSPPAQSMSPPALTALGTGSSVHSDRSGTGGGIPPLTTADKQRFGQLFDRSAGANGFIDGAAAREIFLKARLPSETLSKVWSLVDVDGRGKLTKNEFVVAMHLIQSTIKRAIPSMPASLPRQWLPWLGTGTAPSGAAVQRASITSLPPLSQLDVNGTGRSLQSPVTTGSVKPTAPPSRTAASGTSTATGATDPWVINPAEKLQFDGIFDSVDKSEAGIIGAAEAVPILTRSGLDEETLAHVWDIADSQQRGQLDKSDFAVAMHIVKARLNGYDLPQTVPPQLRASANGVGVDQPTSPHTEPAVRQNQVLGQHQKSSLSDLVSLDDAFFKPLEPVSASPPAGSSPASRAPVASPAAYSEKESGPGSALKFRPTSEFGQKLVGQQSSVVATAAAAALPSHSKEVEETKFETGQLRQQASDLEKSSAAQNQAVKQVSSQHAEIKAEKEKLTQYVNQLRTTYDAEAARVHQTKRDIEATKAEVAQLERDIKLREGGLQALQSQNETDKSTLANLILRRQELETQHADHQRSIDDFENQNQQLQKETEEHMATAAQHEATIQNLKVEVESARVRREELVRQAQEARQRAEAAVKAREEAESAHAQALDERRRAEEEAKREIERQREAETREVHARALAESANPSHLAAVAGGAGVALSAGVGSSLPAAQFTAPSETAASIGGSLGNSVGDSAPDTPQTSPPESEAAVPPVDQNIPAFVLPMGRSESLTSSVLANPPQSVRGDIDVSVPHSPDFEQEAAGRETDSFEFVDAQEVAGHDYIPSDLRITDSGETAPVPEPTGADGVWTPTQVDSDVNTASATPGGAGASTPLGPSVPAPTATNGDSSDDDDGPAPAIPLQYGSQYPEVPHYDVSNSGTPEEIVNMESSSATSSAAQATPAVGPATAVAPAPAVAATVDRSGDEFGDAFDDLEDAKEDEDEFSAGPDDSQSLPKTASGSAGPDEWQQLFAQPTPLPYQQTATMPGAAGTIIPGSGGAQTVTDPSDPVQQLASMGFSIQEARTALERTGYNLSEATNLLLDNL